MSSPQDKDGPNSAKRAPTPLPDSVEVVRDATAAPVPAQVRRDRTPLPGKLPGGAPEADPQHAAQKRVAVSAILAEVENSREEHSQHLWAIGATLLEVVVVLGIYVLLMTTLRLPAPARVDPENSQIGGAPAYVWLQVLPVCWSPPDWNAVAEHASAVAPTSKLQLQGQGDQRFLQVSGVVDPKVGVALRQWASQVDDACLSAAAGPDEFTWFIKARWTPTDRARVAAAEPLLAEAKAGIRALQWGANPKIILESKEFPNPAMRRDQVRAALLKAGLRDFKVVPAAAEHIDAATRASWRALAVEPMVREQRGALAVQMAAWTCLMALFFLLARARFGEDEPLMANAEGLTRTIVGVSVASIVLLVFIRRLGLEWRDLRSALPEPDNVSRNLAFLAYGLALPAAHATALHGYVQRRLARSFSSRSAALITALLYPIVPPLLYQFPMWWALGLIASYLVWSTGRLRSGLTIAILAQVLVAYVAFY